MPGNGLAQKDRTRSWDPNNQALDYLQVQMKSRLWAAGAVGIEWPMEFSVNMKNEDHRLFPCLPAMLYGMKDMNSKQRGLVFNYCDLLPRST
jgi:hypothetical protein